MATVYDFTVTDRAGQEGSLADYKGKGLKNAALNEFAKANNKKYGVEKAVQEAL